MITLRDYQRESVNAIYRHFENHTDNPLIVIPTGGGKAPTLATFIKEAIEQYAETRVLCLVHVRELVEQDYMALLRAWPQASDLATVCSAGLGRKDTTGQIVFASIQSIYKDGTDLQWRDRKRGRLQPIDLVIVDEAHLIPHKDEGMYRQLFADLTMANPYLKIVGYTATPFRMTSGRLDEGEGALFGRVAYDIGIGELIDGGWLCPPVPKAMATHFDVSSVHTRGGEFVASELAAAVDVDSITRAAVDEIVAYGQDRRSWLAFGSSVQHAHHIAEAVRDRGYEAATITGKTPAGERASLVQAFKTGRIRCLTNCDVLTVGFDAPATDLLAVLRPTKSPGLWVQICGRGTRLSPETGKTNCLVLDFGENAARFGPIDQITGRKRQSGGGGEAPVKECPNCASIVAAGVRFCPNCNYEFPPPATSIEATASTAAILSSQLQTEWTDVREITYARHEKADKPPSLRVEYRCGCSVHREWITLEHSGFPREKACRWWAQRSTSAGLPPNRVDEALGRVAELREPRQIAVRPAGKYTEVVGYRFG